MKEFFKEKSNIFLYIGIILMILAPAIGLLLMKNSLKNNDVKQKINSRENNTFNQQEILNTEGKLKDDMKESTSKIEKEENTASTSDKKDMRDSNRKISQTSFINELEKKVSDIKTDSIKETVKKTFIDIIDFIFYDKEIKGYTFKQLTTTGKLKVIKAALTIDHKIDEYFPDYKNNIKGKYQNIKGKLAVYYLEQSSKLCNKVGSTTCNRAREDFKDMKEKFKLSFSIIKEGATRGKDALKEWYQIFKSK